MVNNYYLWSFVYYSHRMLALSNSWEYWQSGDFKDITSCFRTGNYVMKAKELQNLYGDRFLKFLEYHEIISSNNT